MRAQALTADRHPFPVPKGAALALSIACVAGAAAFFVAGLFWVAAPLLIVSVAFDVLFVIALRADTRPNP